MRSVPVARSVFLTAWLGGATLVATATAIAPADLRRAAFGRPHGISVGLLGVRMLAATASLVQFARTLSSGRTTDA